jgi:hypothetical protein
LLAAGPQFEANEHSYPKSLTTKLHFPDGSPFTDCARSVEVLGIVNAPVTGEALAKNAVWPLGSAGGGLGGLSS